MPSGVVALAVSSDFPKLLIEQIYSSSPQDAPLIHRNLQTGMDIELRRTFELTAVLHVTKLNDGRIQLTVMPINYGRYVFTGADGGFDLQPPGMLNVAAGWPIVHGDRMESATQAYVDYRTRAGLGPLASRVADAQKSPRTALKGVDVPIDVAPPIAAASPSPAGAVATPALLARNTVETPAVPTPTASVAFTPPATLVGSNVTVRPALPVDEPPKRVAAAPPVIRAVQAAPSGVALQPFLADPGPHPVAPATALANSPHTTWTMYPPGKAPTGKNVHVNDIAALSQHGALTGEPVYLTGQFVVRVTGEDRLRGVKNAILRSGNDSNVRVIVQYPADHALPQEGAEIIRDSQRPYQIMDVTRGADGTLNVKAREVTGQ